MQVPSQEQIMESWESRTPCVVTIVCTTYNHENYIRDALDGFLVQKTTFPFEIIVHDDASTDGTQAIIKEYEARFPLIIKPILQLENQYSKGGFKPVPYAARRASGNYIAVCEGDDYWNCSEKIERQVRHLSGHPQVDLCVHPAYRESGNGKALGMSWQPPMQEVMDPGAILTSRTGTFAPTASYMVRKEVLTEIPDWVIRDAPVGDLFIELYGARRGGVLYLDAPMSTYRVQTRNSWSDRTYNNLKALEAYAAAMTKCFEQLAGDFVGYEEAIQWKQAWLNCHYAHHAVRLCANDAFRIYIDASHSAVPGLSRKQRLMYRLRSQPWLIRFSMNCWSLVSRLSAS